MKKKLFSAYDIFFIVCAAAIFFFAVMLPPVRSVADQGDFERVMRPCGLDFPTGHEYSFYAWAERFFRMEFTRADLLLYVPRLLMLVPSTAFIYPVTAAKLLCAPFGAFDTRALAAVMFVWYTTVCLLLLRRARLKTPAAKITFICIFLIIFYNGVTLTIFNSLYGQSVIAASFMTLILASVCLFEDTERADVKKLVFFTIASCLLLGSKLQCVAFAPFLIAAVIYAARRSNRMKIGILCAAVILWHGAGGYIINGSGLNRDTQYNSVFYGILKDSTDSESDLISLGLDPDMAADSGKHAYLDASEYKYPPRTEATEKMFYSKMSSLKLVKFYITHPSRFISAMEKTANEAFSNKINLGTFEKKYGFEAGKHSYRLTLWDDMRSHLPQTLWFIVSVWCVFLAAVIIKRKSRYAPALLALLIVGAAEFAMPYVGNGAADIPKQLFVFNTIFDFMVCAAVYGALISLERVFLHRGRFFSKNS